MCSVTVFLLWGCKFSIIPARLEIHLFNDISHLHNTHTMWMSFSNKSCRFSILTTYNVSLKLNITADINVHRSFSSPLPPNETGAAIRSVKHLKEVLTDKMLLCYIIEPVTSTTKKY